VSLAWYHCHGGGAAARQELCAWSVCQSLYGWLGVSIYHAMARLIFLSAGFVPDFAAGPLPYAGATVLALSPAQVRGPSGLARVLPRGDGIVQAGLGAWSFAVEFLPCHVGAAAFDVLHGS